MEVKWPGRNEARGWQIAQTTKGPQEWGPAFNRLQWLGILTDLSVAQCYRPFERSRACRGIVSQILPARKQMPKPGLAVPRLRQGLYFRNDVPEDVVAQSPNEYARVVVALLKFAFANTSALQRHLDSLSNKTVDLFVRH